MYIYIYIYIHGYDEIKCRHNVYVDRCPFLLI